MLSNFEIVSIFRQLCIVYNKNNYICSLFLIYFILRNSHKIMYTTISISGMPQSVDRG